MVNVGTNLESDVVRALDAWVLRHPGFNRASALRLFIRLVLENDSLLRAANQRALGMQEGMRAGLARTRQAIEAGVRGAWPRR